MNKNEVTQNALSVQIDNAQKKVPLAIQQMLDDGKNGKENLKK